MPIQVAPGDDEPEKTEKTTGILNRLNWFLYLAPDSKSTIVRLLDKSLKASGLFLSFTRLQISESPRAPICFFWLAFCVKCLALFRQRFQWEQFRHCSHTNNVRAHFDGDLLQMAAQIVFSLLPALVIRQRWIICPGSLSVEQLLNIVTLNR